LIRQADREYRPAELERSVRERWASSRAYLLAKAHRAGGEDFYFIDGPPYTTGSIHLGTAWNKTLKDVVIRYLRMNGKNVRDQPGYDMHGLPIEVKVEKALGIKNKKEIEALGIDNFISKCREFALANLENMTRQFSDLGVWMDWERPYTTITNPYIEAAWWTLRRAADKDLLTRFERSTTWCPRCQTALAEAELEYWDEEDPSIYVKFKAVDADEYFLVWTTTPWTLPADLAVTIHPDYTYVRARVTKGGTSETLIFVRDRLEDIKKVGDYDSIEVLSEHQGSDLEGRKYVQPLIDEVPWHRGRNEFWLHKVLVDSTMVTAENSGCVHTAPGHGPADFEIGKRYELPPFCPVDGTGRFTAEAGKYAGMELEAGNDIILEDLRKKGLLLQSGKITHRYGHCWRCDTPIIYIITMQWYLRITEVKDRMLAEVARVRWFPPWAGASRQKDWVEGARDWCVSRQRYWGIPLPIWECDKGHRRVAGRIADLREGQGYTEGMDLHRPWIDGVTFNCKDCGGTMRRIPDVMDVWLDSGVCSWAQLGYPSDEAEFRRWFPCRWITEAHDQTRGWFYSQLGAGVVAFDRAPYDSVLMHGWSLDAQGRPMSKSLGNVVEPSELTQKYGADALRYYFLLANAPWEDMPFSLENVKSAFRSLNILWNVHVFSTTYMALDRFDPTAVSLATVRARGRPEDRWLLSRLESLTKKVTDAIAVYNLHHAARALEDFVLEDLSRWYVRLVRDRVWVEGDVPDKAHAHRTLYEALDRTARLLAPFCPHISDAIYADLGGRHPTVHMEDWPVADEKAMEPALEDGMAVVRKALEAALNARNRANVKLRWPLGRMIVSAGTDQAENALLNLSELLKDQANCRTVEVVRGGWSGRNTVPVPKMKALGPRFGREAKAVADAVVKGWTQETGAALLGGKPATVETPAGPLELTTEHVDIHFTLPEGFWEAPFDGGTVYVDARIDDELRSEGFARDLVRRLQQMRKEAGLNVEDHIRAYATLEGAQSMLIAPWHRFIMNETRSEMLTFTEEARMRLLEMRIAAAPGTLVREWELDQGEKIVLGIERINLAP
jgi:isoleucyl-tRNA synthetase